MRDEITAPKRSYWDIYQTKIARKLKKLDLLAKTSSGEISAAELSGLLEISADELAYIKEKSGIEEFNRSNICRVLREGSSEICLLYRREIEKGSPLVYTREDIAYIYGFDREALDAICDELGIIETTSYFFKDIFEKMPPNHKR